MLIYFLTYCAIFISGLFSFYKWGYKEKRTKFISLSSFILLVSLFSLRHPSMGVDLGYDRSYGYLASFSTIAKFSWRYVLEIKSFSNYEKGYMIFNKLVSSIYNNIQFFLFACALCSLITIFYVISKKSENALFSTIIFMGLPTFNLNFSGLRQAIAMGICFLSIIFIKDKKPIKFILLVLFASTFHSSAIIFLFSYPIYKVKLRKITRFLMLFLIPLVYINRYPLFNILSKIFKDDALPGETGAINLLLIFILIYVFCISFLNYDDEFQSGLTNLFFVACVVQVFGGIYMTAMRVGYYFMLSLILLIPNLITGIKNNLDRKLISIGLITVFTIYGLFSLYHGTWSMSYPYYFFWN